MSEAEPSRARRWGRFFAIVVFSAAFLTAVVHETLLTVFVVQGTSMDPTLREGQRLLVYRPGEPGLGDLVVFRNPNRPEDVLVKRVLAGPGQRVELRSGRVWVDGVPVQEPYLKPGSGGEEGRAEITLPPESYYLLGDNRGASIDSRRIGPIPRDRLVGKVIHRFE